jgi:mono/diheme cytochrome c family protein
MKVRIAIGAFGLLTVFVVVAVTFHHAYSPHGRMQETPAVRPHEEPLLVMGDGRVPFGGGEAIFRATYGDEIRSPLPLKDPEIVAEGERQYGLFCAQCHGKRHDGYGTVGQSFAPRIPDLRSDIVQRMNDGDLFQYISYSFPGSRHPGLASTIEMGDRWRIVGYLKSLGLRP